MRVLPRLAALALVALLLAPCAGAAAPLTREEVVAALSLGTAKNGGTLASLAPRGDPLDALERELLHAQLRDPTSLLTLPGLPANLLTNLTLARLGPIQGPHVEDVPPSTLLAAIALLPPGATLPASSLRTFHEKVTLRGEDPQALAADWAALQGGSSASYDPGSDEP